MDYKEKGKKSCYIKSNYDDDKVVLEMGYVAIEEDPNGERYDSETSLISHVSKNDSWIVDSGFLLESKVHQDN